MQVKRYVAPSYAEALIMAKNELGTEAIIVETRKIRVGGFLGLFGRHATELTVASDQTAARAPAPPAAVAPAAPGPALEKEVAALRTAVTRLLEKESVGPEAVLHGFQRQVYDNLVERGTEAQVALDLAQRIAGEGDEGRRSLHLHLAAQLGPGSPISAQPGQRRVVALIGPTGVGKTTTLAKLAAHFALERGLKVAMLTSDTFRIAAIEQLRTYADILGVPLHAVDSPLEVARAMKETAEYDLVLMDTGGRSHRDASRMHELREILSVLRPDETHLVYSLTSNPRDAYEALEAYVPLGVNRLTFTKLDEATSPGLILNLRARCDQTIGYVTFGQSVPDDIISADRADFSKILAGV